MVNVLSKENFDSFINQDNLVLVDFFAEWCGPCKMLAPIVDKVSENYKDVIFAKMNIDDNLEIAERFSIAAIPLLIMFKNGKIVDKSMGLIDEDELKTIIEKNK